MSQNELPATRRTLLIGAVVAAAGLPLLTVAGSADAAGALPKANARYQEHPNGAAQCSKCNYFLAKAGPGATNLCKIVAGPVLPTAWCTMYAPKPA